jgi:hypothetical protein
MCDSVKEESRSLREQRTNEVLYTLTVSVRGHGSLFPWGSLCRSPRRPESDSGLINARPSGVRSLPTLQLVTTIFVPLQFVTGIYGMNFTNTAGRPSMPELLWPHGYVFFWCLCATLFFSLVCYFKYVKKWL